MTDLTPADIPMMVAALERHTEQTAYDSGEGKRAMSHHRDNRYDPVTSPKLFAAYERGFADLDRKLCGAGQ